MNVEKLRIACTSIAIRASVDKRICTISCKFLLHRFSHFIQAAILAMALLLPRKEEDH